MCRCRPQVKTPYCGRPGCTWPGNYDSYKTPLKQMRVLIEQMNSALDVDFQSFDKFKLSSLFVSVEHLVFRARSLIMDCIDYARKNENPVCVCKNVVPHELSCCAYILRERLDFILAVMRKETQSHAAPCGCHLCESLVQEYDNEHVASGQDQVAAKKPDGEGK